MRTHLRDVPPIFYGAYVLAALSLAWSAYAITDLMHSGPFGLSVALAGDIGWLTIMWAEQQRRGGWPVIVAGWVIAVGVGFLLVLHGVAEQSVSQAIAGPFVVLVAKGVATVALFVTRDPAALTEAQEAEIHGVIRDGEYQARLNKAQRDIDEQQADAIIERITQQARITAARDRTHAQLIRDRIELRAELALSAPLALSPAEPDELPAEPLAHTAEPSTLSPSTGGASSLLSAPEPPAQRPNAFGFSAHTSAQSAQRVEAIEKVAELLAQDPGLTAAQVEEALSVSPATAKRYLREARSPRGGSK